MRVDLPVCPYKSCRYHYGECCVSQERYERCEYSSQRKEIYDVVKEISKKDKKE